MEKLVRKITSMNVDFGKWYTDVVVRAELIDYTGVRGCVVLRPYGYAIWEIIMSFLNHEFRKKNIENVAMPLLIPESLLQKEKNHVKGFAPEVAWVTIGGNEVLTERLCIRPTSEALFCSHFSKTVKSWRDLPKIYNQWCSVVRWEKSTRPLLRSVEFQWQEGHTVHATSQEAESFAISILDLYRDFFEHILCVPVILGRKTDSEKFAGADITYTVECMMKDGKALQAATSHYFGNNFARAFDVKFQNKNNKSEFVYQTSWGLTTRVIASVIMAHGDDDGLVLPPDIAPIQIVIVPIMIKNNAVFEKCNEIFNILNRDFRVKLDVSDQSPGWKFAEYEMKGVPIRLEIGPKDVDSNSCVIIRRDNREKITCGFSNILTEIPVILTKIKCNLYKNAEKFCRDKIFVVKNLSEFKTVSKQHCFIKTLWCGSDVCEQYIKDNFGFSSRCIPLDENQCLFEASDHGCVVCEKKASSSVYWGEAY
ncbi:MAG: proline--tRNA ligase [Candidatus Improbicoccus devescovinae]|nr:MAG: proline--tRNA ligase [Candidatus Improbicoccus devescovinae]